MNFPIILFLQNLCSGDNLVGQQLSLEVVCLTHSLKKNAIFWNFMRVKTFQNIIENVLNFYDYIFNNWITGKNGGRN